MICSERRQKFNVFGTGKCINRQYIWKEWFKVRGRRLNLCVGGMGGGGWGGAIEEIIKEIA